MDRFTLYIDDREKHVIPYFDDAGLKCAWSVTRLVHGDYCILFGSKLLCIIERKTWQDLAASIRDKRILNIEKLKILREQSGCRLIVLMEGRKPKHDVGHVSIRGMSSKLDHLMIRDQVHIIYTAHEADTTVRIAELIRSMNSIDIDALGLPENKAADEVLGGAVSPAIALKTEEKNALSIWCAFPRVDIMTAAALTGAGYTVLDLACGKIPADVVATLVYPSGRVIGKDNAAAIVGGARKHSTHVAVLAAVKGVTKASAETILEAIGDDLLGIEKISPIKFSRINLGGRKVGDALTARVWTALSVPDYD